MKARRISANEELFFNYGHKFPQFASTTQSSTDSADPPIVFQPFHHDASDSTYSEHSDGGAMEDSGDSA